MGIPIRCLQEWESGRKVISIKMLGTAFQRKSIEKAGNRLPSSLFPASFFYGFDDRIQKLQFLACGTVQRFDSLGYCCCVDIGHPFCQFHLAFVGFGVIHDQIDRRHASDNGHLLGRLPGILENLRCRLLSILIECMFAICLHIFCKEMYNRVI